MLLQASWFILFVMSCQCVRENFILQLYTRLEIKCIMSLNSRYSFMFCWAIFIWQVVRR